MASLANFFRKIGFRKRDDPLAPEKVEELRNTFKARYLHFKLLLSANNKALEIMSDFERALRGAMPFGMAFIRANCTAVSVNVYKIVHNLDRLAPDRYTNLFGRFKEIQDQVNQVLSRRMQPADGPLVVPLKDVDKEMADHVGSKMANLGEMGNNLGLPVPEGFVATSFAYRRFFAHNELQSEIDRRLQVAETDELDKLYALSAGIQQLIIRAEIPEDLREAIAAAYGRLEAAHGQGVRVSMRSSALGEDAEGTSFAGQYRSELNVSKDNLLQAYKEIIASKYTLQAITYRANRGMLDEDIAMCVGCMAMVNARSGGVTYSRNPLNIRDDSITINAVPGLPKSVVDGTVASDLFVVSRTPVPTLRRTDIKRKEVKFVCYPDEGVCRMELVGEEGVEPSISEEQALQLAETALVIENHYGCPQDIEWAFDEAGKLYLLQCRPLKQAMPGSGTRGEAAVSGDVLLHGGETASSGVASGPVFLLKKNSDALRFPEGAVLVTAQALPVWAALLNRASAVLTEQGSVAGHLANVAREFEIPAVFGMADATRLLREGDIVTVDADGGLVYRGRIESLLEAVPERKNLMEGSPVYHILKDLSRHIVPLNLLDPESNEFRIRNCRTFHDITRFCHEKSVKEMFNFGRDHHFSERASKQLVCATPMQWWIINLDDGFKEDVSGRYVSIDNIASIPMLALWKGIVAVPWEGPPAMDSKGFMSILLEASANPAFDPSMPSPYSNRNYFMLSRNFCTLSSRFGFHFSTIEALVSERPHENYVSFSFKGGAADFQRRLRRAVFISSILEEFGFRAQVKEDGLFARIEGLDEAVMLEKLEILGYLLIHTRQLDMVMANDAVYNTQRERLLRDIEGVIHPPAPLYDDHSALPH